MFVPLEVTGCIEAQFDGHVLGRWKVDNRRIVFFPTLLNTDIEDAPIVGLRLAKKRLLQHPQFTLAREPLSLRRISYRGCIQLMWPGIHEGIEAMTVHVEPCDSPHNALDFLLYCSSPAFEYHQITTSRSDIIKTLPHVLGHVLPWQKLESVVFIENTMLSNLVVQGPCFRVLTTCTPDASMDEHTFLIPDGGTPIRLRHMSGHTEGQAFVSPRRPDWLSLPDVIWAAIEDSHHSAHHKILSMSQVDAHIDHVLQAMTLHWAACTIFRSSSSLSP